VKANKMHFKDLIKILGTDGTGFFYAQGE